MHCIHKLPEQKEGLLPSGSGEEVLIMRLFNSSIRWGKIFVRHEFYTRVPKGSLSYGRPCTLPLIILDNDISPEHWARTLVRMLRDGPNSEHSPKNQSKLAQKAILSTFMAKGRLQKKTDYLMTLIKLPLTPTHHPLRMTYERMTRCWKVYHPPTVEK